ncbi:MAG: nitroreductase family protein [Nanoarchaeota archaeon]|nr:nitroreductase family protein [Nanoarchaeota archaeon]MBU4124264.1 nitroreductase family protein [Nanoarchaeota archaeon]
MNVKNAIKERKSIRKFKEKSISNSLIKEVIDAARKAPSSHNLQPWNFVVVKDKKKILEFEENDIFIQKEMYKTPVIIVCCVDDNPYSKHSNRKLEIAMNFINLSLASAFLVLRATELGLGTCYVAWCNKEKIKKLLNIPKEVIVPYVIVMGYPAENPSPTNRKKLSEIMHFEKW